LHQAFPVRSDYDLILNILTRSFVAAPFIDFSDIWFKSSTAAKLTCSF
jgi:hypothetical protein